MKYSEIRCWIDNYLEQCSKEDIVDLFNEMIPNFKHLETNKYLDDKM